ncbi:hypothetical protein CMV_002076 [Castanea mollissima]|uniref:Uncharacterized protein n=1 Tax=Castanea mollissima TaxID=60419 RepID=A0A8J4VWG5_9ROSI|nr:hypothetical protein CMV_002076 [Castanea mollissima]
MQGNVVVGFEQDRGQVDGGCSEVVPMKGGAVIGLAETVSSSAKTAGKYVPDFEELISVLDQAIQSEPVISNSNSIQVEQLVDIEVMDEELISCQRVLKGKQVEPCGHSFLQGDDFSFNIGKVSGQERSKLSKGRPKRSGSKNKGGLLSLQGPSSGGSAEVRMKKSMSKDNILAICSEDGLKQGTWKRSSNDNPREAEKAELVKKKTKVSNIEGLHVFSSVDRTISVEVALQPRRAQ